MELIKQGSGEVSEAVEAIAAALAQHFAETVLILTGVRLADEATGRLFSLDLVTVTDTAMAIGLDAHRPEAAETLPQVERWLKQWQSRWPADGPLPVSAFLLNASGRSVRTSHVADTALTGVEPVVRFILQASAAGRWPGAAGDIASLWARRLLEADGGHMGNVTPVTPSPLRPASPLRRAWRRLGGVPGRVDASLQNQVRQVASAGRGQPIRPADVGRLLVEAMLSPENLLEDALYTKVAPNEYVVELSQANYDTHYRAIERELEQQWRRRLLDALTIANSRAGRPEYRFGGAVRVQIEPVTDLAEDQARLQCHIRPDVAEAPAAAEGFLELLPTGRRWALRPDVTLIGRHPECDVHLDLPAVQEKRLVGGQHAYIRLGPAAGGGRFHLFDGTPDGRPSVNGTFANGARVPAEGVILKEGDVIILAAVDPNRPRPDAPGVAAFIFRETEDVKREA